MSKYKFHWKQYFLQGWFLILKSRPLLITWWTFIIYTILNQAPRWYDYSFTTLTFIAIYCQISYTDWVKVFEEKILVKHKQIKLSKTKGQWDNKEE